MRSSKKVILLPKHQRLLEQVGENLKLARKRRKWTLDLVAQRVNIHRTTLMKIEKGDPSVSFGAYFRVLFALGLQDDVLQLAANDTLGQKLRDIELLQ